MPTPPTILTLGHSSHPLGTFIWLLRKNRIEAQVVLADPGRSVSSSAD